MGRACLGKENNDLHITPASMNAATRLLLIEDHAIVRAGLELMLAAEADLVIGGTADAADEALQLIDHEPFDFVVLDIGLRHGSGLDLIGQIRTRRPDLPILVLSMHQERFYAERVLRSGAQGYIMKQSDPAQIVPAIRRILGGEFYLSPGLSEEILRRTLTPAGDARAPTEQLSDREAEVVRFIGDGYSTREIADELSLSVKTIESYRANIKRKLDLRSGTELARFAYDWSARSMGVAAGADRTETRASIADAVSASSRL